MMRQRIFFIIIFTITANLFGQKYDESFFSNMEWRNIGPNRGGRSLSSMGSPGRPNEYYFGATGGGLWKTTDAGNTWFPVTDGQISSSSIGAVAVAETNPDIVYIGGGETQLRGSITQGDGVYKSIDGGKTWKHIGLSDTQAIARIRIHPTNPDIVYVAALGHPYGDNDERGIFRSRDGGETWEKILYNSPKAGGVDISIDRTNPKVIYASLWQVYRKAWKMWGGGPFSGIYKTTDGGDTWEELTKNSGMPEGPIGKIGMAVSPADPKRVWAVVEASEGGVFRSDDGGKNWERTNDDRKIRQRHFYYSRIVADPLDRETVYALNTRLYKSTDGGVNFDTQISVPHGDNHDLWINRDNNQIMINANDGGANVSFNGGASWSTQQNQPTAQFYRVITDNRFPYYVYGGQQDNSSVAIASRASGGIDWKDWYPVAGCESAYLAFDPDNPVLVYGGCYQGLIDELNVETGNRRSVMAYEYLGLGSDPIDQKYRFNWNAPIVASPHDPNIIYHAGNVVLKTTDRGESWEAISPDLTLDKKENLGRGGSPITNEAAGGEIYHTILYLEPSEHDEGTLWAGTDDGLVHVTKDGGKSWKNVTPNGMKEGMVNAIDVSPHDPSTAYIAFTRYKFGDFAPYIYKTNNLGKSWKKVVRGIPSDAYVRVVREDPVRKGLLYAGTELGVFVSFDDGKEWQPFQLNLPIVPITDLTIRNNDLVASTLGRAFWILDNLSPLQTMSADLAKAELHLFSPRETHLISYGGRADGTARGKNPPSGVVFQYLLGAEGEAVEGLKLSIIDSRGDTVRTFTSNESEPEQTRWGVQRVPGLGTEKGMNRFVWNMRRENLTAVPKLFSSGSRAGYRVGPGKYTASMTLGDNQAEVSVKMLTDPRNDQAVSYRKQQQILADLYESANDLYSSVNSIRSMRSQLKSIMKNVKGTDDSEKLLDAGKSAVKALSEWEMSVVSLKLETFQDVVNFDSGLDADITELMSKIDGSGPSVSEGSEERYHDLMDQWDEKKSQLEEIVEEHVGRFNDLYREMDIPAVIVPEN